MLASRSKISVPASLLTPLLALASVATPATTEARVPPSPSDIGDGSLGTTGADGDGDGDGSAPTLDVATWRSVSQSTASSFTTTELRPDDWTVPDDEVVPGPVSSGGDDGFTPSAGTPGPTLSSFLHVRGGSLIPPYDGRTIYWDAPGSGYEVRRLIGVEPLGDPANFYVSHSNVYKRTGWNGTYGRQLVMRNGGIFEGCALQESGTAYLCDFKVDGQPKRLAPDRSSAYWRRVLVDWGSYQASYLGGCGTSIVGMWTGLYDLGDVGISCLDYGPFTVR